MCCCKCHCGCCELVEFKVESFGACIDSDFKYKILVRSPKDWTFKDVMRLSLKTNLNEIVPSCRSYAKENGYQTFRIKFARDCAWRETWQTQ